MEIAIKPVKNFLRTAHHRLRMRRNAKMDFKSAQRSLKWNSSERDPLPHDRQQVLVSVEGVYYIAVFDAVKALFRVEDELLQTVFRLSGPVIDWCEFERGSINS